MKRLIFVMALLITLGYSANAHHHFQVSPRFGVFYSSLSGYGEWIDSDWGSAWRPTHVVHGWRPYMDGRWIWTDYGWYWVSYEPFGWATFHYGRWQYDNYYGWIWIPNEVWGPAWVEWRYDDDYIGWAPLPPIATFRIDIGLSFSSRWIAPMHYWNFIPCRNFTSTRIIDYVQPIDRVRRIYGSTREGTMIRGEEDRVVNRGIDLNFVERRTNTRISRVEVVQRGEGDKYVREGRRERVEVYRPRLDDNSRSDRDRIPAIKRRDQELQRDIPKELPENRNIRQKEQNQRGLDRNADRQRVTLPDRRVEQQRDARREQPRWDVQRKNNDNQPRREQVQPGREDRKNSDQQGWGKRDMPRNERAQPQVREKQPERAQPSQRQPESRRGDERKRRP